MPLRQVFTGDASQLQRELEKTQQQYARLEEQLRRVTSESSESGRKGSGALRDMETAALSAITQFAGLQHAIQAVNEAIQKQRELSEQAMQTQMSVADTQRELRRGLGARADEWFDWSEAETRRIQLGVGVRELQPIQLAAAQAVSQVADPRIALQAVEIGFRAGRGNAAAQQQITKGALLLTELMPGLTPAQAVSMLMAGYEQTPVGDIAEVIEPSVRGIAAMQAHVSGQDQVTAAAEEMAFLAALAPSFAGKMEITQSVASTVSGRAREFFRGNIPGLRPSTRAAFLKEIGEDPGTLLGRFQAIEALPEELENRFYNMFGMASWRGTIETFVRGPGLQTAISKAASLRPNEALLNRLMQDLETQTPEMQMATEEEKDLAKYFQTVLMDRGATGAARARGMVSRAIDEMKPSLWERAGLSLQEKWARLNSWGPPDELQIQRSLLQSMNRPLERWFAGPEETARRQQIIDETLNALNRLTDQIGASNARAQPNRHHE